MGKAGKSVIWSAIERFSVQGLQFLLSLIIARLVTPSEYGLIAMITIFMALAQTMVDSGFGNSLIQKKDRNQIDYSTVFYFNLSISILLYFVLFATAPLIARFYKQPELVGITRVAALNLVIMGLSVIQKTRLTILLDFKLQARLSIFAVIIGGFIGIVLAFNNFGVWALVYQTLITNLVQTLLLWVFAKWKPSFTYSWDSFKRLFGFGSKLLISSLIQTIFLNMYSMIIGRIYNPTDTGLYNRAYTISQYPSVNLTQIISRVVYPLQCSHQTDKNWLEESFIQYIKLSSFVIFPILAFIAVTSDLLVEFILSERWIDCAPLVSILCLAYIWLPISTLNNHLILSQGASGIFLKAEIIKKIIAVGIMVATLPFGIRILCWGLAIYNIIDLAIIIYFTRTIFDLGFFKQIRAILPIILLTSIASLFAFLTSYMPATTIIRLFSSFLLFFVTYTSLSYLFRFKEIDVIFDIIKRFKK